MVWGGGSAALSRGGTLSPLNITRRLSLSFIFTQTIMTTNGPTPDRPVFPTPNPDDLQSEETQAAAHQRVAEQQGSETDVDTDPSDETTADPASLLGSGDDLSLRQSGTIGLSGG